MIKRLRNPFAKRINAWLDRRIPRAARQKLNHRSIFIFPSRFGLLFILLCLVLFLLGTNYQNNLILATSYFLLSLLLVSMVNAYHNVRGMVVHFGHIEDCYASHSVQIPVSIEGNRAQGNLICQIADERDCFSIPLPQNQQRHSLDYKILQRGKHTVPRIRFSVDYPFGLIRCWTKLAPAQSVFVYPSPERCQLQPHQFAQQASAGNQLMSGGQEDFDRLRTMQQGEPRSHIAWKVAAQGKGIYTKQFSQPATVKVMLSLASTPGHDVEQKLRHLAYLVSHAGRQGYVFSLQLGTHFEPPSKGRQHVKSCLRLLAEYQHG